jgi:hypothetical protein
MQRVVSVWSRWGDYVLGVHDLRPGESLSVGAQPLVHFRGGMASVYAEAGAAERQLRVGETVTVTVGELDYTLCCSEPAEAATFAPSRRPWALLDAAVLGMLVAASVWHAAPAPRLLHSGIGALAELGSFASPEPAEKQPIREGVFAVAAERAAEVLRLPGDMRCGRAELGAHFGASGRYGVAGPSNNADPHLARPVLGRGYPAAVAPSGHWGQPEIHQGSAGPTAPFARDTALGTDPNTATGNMWGDEVHDAWGEGGLGRAGHPGGVVKRFDIAPLTDSRTAQLRVVHTGLRVTGARKASEIGRVMAHRMADFRACAEGVEPAAVHDVELAFEVDQAGRAATSGAGVGALEKCLEQSLASAAFAAGASELSHVVYPLHFVAANVELKGPPLARLAATAPCDCGG